MKRIAITAAALATLTLCISPIRADSSYKKSRWPSKIEQGALKVQGSGYGGWGTRWVTVDSGVASYGEVGTSHGPVLVYSKGPKAWFAVQLQFNTGAVQNRRNFSTPVSIIRGGRFGALLKAGTACYDYSWKQLRTIDCRTGRFE